MPAYPPKADYYWTDLDAVNAAAGKDPALVEDMVSPYGIPPKALPGAGKNYKAGDKVTLHLSLRNQGFPWKLDWRFPKDPTLEWTDVPPEVTGYTDVASLCAALHKFDKARFPAKFYDLAGEGKNGNVKAGGWDTGPNMIFDYWENSAWRYAQSSKKGEFSWSQDKGTVKIPAGTKLKVLGKAPIKISVPAGPGLLTTKEPTKLHEELREDMRNIMSSVLRIEELLRKSNEVMAERMKMVHGVNAFKAVFWACSTETTDIGANIAGLNYQKAATCVTKAKQMAKEIPMKELLKPDPSVAAAGNAGKGIEEMMRKSLAMSDDMAAEIKKLAFDLEFKLLSDMFFAGRCQEFAKQRLDKKLQDDAIWKRVHDQLAAVKSVALTTLAEANAGDSLGDKLFTLHATLPQKPAASASDISTANNPCEVILSMVGRATVDVDTALSGNSSVTKDAVIPLTLTMVGNLAGPPSLSIAILQAAATSALPKAAEELKAGKLTTLGEKVLTSLDKHFDQTQEMKDLAANIRKAFAANDQDALFDLKKDYAAQVASKAQGSNAFKGGIAILQVLSLIMSYNAVKDKADKGEATVVDYTSMALATVQTGLAVLEAGLQALGMLREGSKAMNMVSGAGLWLGRVSAFLGIVVGFIALDEASKKGDNIGVFIALTQIFGNFFMLMGMLTTAVPGLQLVGIAILAIGVIVQVYQAVTASSGFEPNNANRVAAQVYGFITSNPFYDLCCAHDAEFEETMKELYKAASSEYLPYARNTIVVHDTLKKYGFGRAEIKLLVNTSDMPMDFMLSGAMPSYEI